ncbi:Hypothetical predicted protein [Podarcis lilfordi]|uniref:Reverse transcriptase domain-containing protein n=1 Tax=Podarcis lilfordi TaxID=74358 RepID=A0AA35LCU4_9SAUR|nr:Hypothetical predicted protein [Podarcis lilfordi]
MPTLTDEEQEFMDSPITPEEIDAVLKNLKPHKAPGPDDFTAEFYKKFKEPLMPYMTRLFNDIIKGGPHPQNLDPLQDSLHPKTTKRQPQSRIIRPNLINKPRLQDIHINLGQPPKNLPTQVNSPRPDWLCPWPQYNRPHQETTEPDRTQQGNQTPIDNYVPRHPQSL